MPLPMCRFPKLIYPAARSEAVVWLIALDAEAVHAQQRARFLKLRVQRNPYPGALGNVARGAYADLILANGNPLENLDLVTDPAANFALIMKDGKIYKNMANSCDLFFPSSKRKELVTIDGIFRAGFLFAFLAGLLVFHGAAPAYAQNSDLVINNGRVMVPETIDRFTGATVH